MKRNMGTEEKQVFITVVLRTSSLEDSCHSGNRTVGVGGWGVGGGLTWGEGLHPSRAIKILHTVAHTLPQTNMETHIAPF